MTKMQKVWLGIFLAMFVVPEVLWSPVVKFWISWTQPIINGHYRVWRENFLDRYGNANLWSYVLLFQFFGILFTTIYLLVIRKSFQNKILFWVIFGLLLIATVIMFYIQGFSTLKVSPIIP